MKYIVKGLDAYGHPVEEDIEITAPTWRDKLRHFTVRILGIRLAHKLGLTNFRYISGIKVEP